MSNSLRIAALCAALACAGQSSLAADPPRENQVNLTASSTMEVTRDLLTVTLSTTREGSDAATVQAGLKQTLDQALAEAKRHAQPGALDIQTGQFSLGPRYGRDGRINGWQGTAELILEGTDATRVAQVAGKLSSMNIVNVSYGLSRALREKHESEVTQQAIQKYRQKAGEVAKAFGFSGFALSEVAVRSGESGYYPAAAPRMMMAKAADESAPLPVEPGKGTITVTVSGSVILTK